MTFLRKLLFSADSFEKYCGLHVEEALDAQVPLLFISFPSAKDPNWINHPGRENKSTCAIVTLATWEWFKQWESKPVKRRGKELINLSLTGNKEFRIRTIFAVLLIH